MPNSTAARACVVDGCLKPSGRGGMCVAHYARFRRTGDAEKRSRTEKGALTCLSCGGDRSLYGGRLRCKPCHAAKCAERYVRTKGSEPRAVDPAKRRARNRRRKARKKEAVCLHGDGCVSAQFLANLYASPCFYCGNGADHADHYYPLARGGRHCSLNIVPACADCNLQKGSKTPQEWVRFLERS